jgi:anthranilate synthase component 1
MEIIDELEPIKRGGYGGAIGYLSYTGDLDTCIHIRTVVVAGGRAHVQAGGGTVADAKPAYEFAEYEAKTKAVLRALELAAEQPEWPCGSWSSTTTTRSPTTSCSTWGSSAPTSRSRATTL